MLYDIILYHIFIIYYICYIIYTYIIYTYIIYTYIIIIYTYIIFIYYIYIYMLDVYIYNIILYMYIIYIHHHICHWVAFLLLLLPPKSWFLLVCLGDKVYLPGSRWFQPSDSTAPVFYLCPRVELLDSWQNGRQIWKPWCPWLVIWKFAVFPTKSANCHWVGSMEFSVVLTTRSWGFCARLPFIQVLKSWTPTKHWIAIIYRTFWNFIPSIYPPT